MKKRLLFLMFTACVFCAVSLNYLSKDTEGNVFPESTEETVANRATVEQTADDTEEAEIKITDVTEEPHPVLDIEQGNMYAYNCLNDEDKILYNEIYNILLELGMDEPVSAKTPEQIADVFQCVLNDHPEIFYVQGYTYTTYMTDDVIDRFTLSGTYTMTRDEIDKCCKSIEKYVAECFAGISPEATEYEKVKYVYEYIISHTEYKQGVKDNQNICSVFLNGQSVCQGYAKATQYLLNRLGIFSTLVIGSVSEGEGHAWNLVFMDGNYYYVDTTWGDASYQIEEAVKDAWESKTPDINYDYLGVTTEQLQRTHTIDNVVPLPYCISIECNYYVKEGTYLEVCDEESIKNIFENALAENREYITVKCSDKDVYQDVKGLLLDEQKIFKFIHKSEGSIAYSDNEAQLSLSFWL